MPQLAGGGALKCSLKKPFASSVSGPGMSPLIEDRPELADVLGAAEADAAAAAAAADGALRSCASTRRSENTARRVEECA